ncbi:MAG: hypothetical protein IJM78_07620 [Prevotella sp.]|nr:hypothetical protein [Prevotella sp.]
MKRVALLLTVILTGTLSMMAQNIKEPDSDCIISMKEFSIFSNCFKDIDTNGDGIVDAAEAKAATILVLDRGGRSNIINNYDFLKHFPNLKAFSVGTTTAEVIDLHRLTKLEKLNLTNATFLQKIILAQGCQPEIINPEGKARIDIEYYVEDETVRKLLEEYSYCEKVEQDGDVCYIVSKEYGKYGIWHNGKLEVPCQYELEELRNKYFTVSQPVLIAVPFADEGIKEFCLRNRKIDADQNGEISIDEAKAVTKLSLMNFKSFIRNIKSYEDLKYFPNLEYFHAGYTYAETLDLSCLKKLKELDVSDCRMLKTIILAKGCKPTIKYPVAYKGEQAKVVYK